MNYWIIKSEPFKFSWNDFVAKGGDHWDGVRNYQARNNLAAMKVGDLAFFYHSNEGKEIVGIAKVVKEAYPDPTTDDARWVAVNFEPVEALPKPVTLAAIKQDSRLEQISLIRQSRLSVLPISRDEYDIILGLAYTP